MAASADQEPGFVVLKTVVAEIRPFDGLVAMLITPAWNVIQRLGRCKMVRPVVHGKPSLPQNTIIS